MASDLTSYRDIKASSPNVSYVQHIKYLHVFNNTLLFTQSVELLELCTLGFLIGQISPLKFQDTFPAQRTTPECKAALTLSELNRRL